MNDESRPQGRESFFALIDKLTADHHEWVIRENGRTLMTQPGLLQQLREAVFSGMEGTGGSSAFGSKPPLDAGATDLLNEITTQATEVLASVSHQPTPYGHAEHYVRLWAGQADPHKVYSFSTRITDHAITELEAHTIGAKRVYLDPQHLTAAALAQRWVDRIETFFNPPSSRAIEAACPACDAQHVYKNQEGSNVRSSALSFVRDPVTRETVEARCVACGASWSPDRFDWLAIAIGASMKVADLLAEYRDGDERGWDAEFEFLRTKHKTRLAKLAKSIGEDGILKPILLGSDGRVWDGHHRLCVAVELGLENVPIKIVPPSHDTPKN